MDIKLNTIMDWAIRQRTLAFEQKSIAKQREVQEFYAGKEQAFWELIKKLLER